MPTRKGRPNESETTTATWCPVSSRSRLRIRSAEASGSTGRSTTFSASGALEAATPPSAAALRRWRQDAARTALVRARLHCPARRPLASFASDAPGTREASSRHRASFYRGGCEGAAALLVAHQRPRHDRADRQAVQLRAVRLVDDERVDQSLVAGGDMRRRRPAGEAREHPVGGPLERAAPDQRADRDARDAPALERSADLLDGEDRP